MFQQFPPLNDMPFANRPTNQLYNNHTWKVTCDRFFDPPPDPQQQNGGNANLREALEE